MQSAEEDLAGLLLLCNKYLLSTVAEQLVPLTPHIHPPLFLQNSQHLPGKM